MVQAVPLQPPMYAARAPEMALQHSPALGRPADAVGLGGDEALVVDGQQKECLNELGLDGLGPDGHYRLPGEDGRTLGDGPDIA